jgi:hypothetical protein
METTNELYFEIIVNTIKFGILVVYLAIFISTACIISEIRKSK